MWVSSKRLEEIEARLKNLEKETVAHEAVTDREVTHSFYGGTFKTFATEKFTVQEVIGALLKHLNVTLKKEHIYEATNVLVVKEKNKHVAK